MSGQVTCEVVVAGAVYFTEQSVATADGPQKVLVRRVARRGEVLALSKAESDRLRKLGAVADPSSASAPAPPEDEPQVLRFDVASATDDELAAFVAEHNADAVIDAAGEDQAAAGALLEAEQARDKPRKGVIEALESLAERE